MNGPRFGSCWDDGPDQCPGCTYCEDARHTPPDEPVNYPDEQQARDLEQAQGRANAEAAHRIAMREQAAARAAAGYELIAATRHPY